MKKLWNSSLNSLTIGLRPSPLSIAQAEEVLFELSEAGIALAAALHLVPTSGDKDLLRSLVDMDKTDFFTKEIDEQLRNGAIDIAIHSAKDLPEPLPPDLACVALTKGVSSADVMVVSERATKPYVVGVSSHRRQQAVQALYPDAICRDIRGTIGARFEQLHNGCYDAIVVAEAALIRLGMEPPHQVRLPGDTAPLQGRLAIVARKNDVALRNLFSSIDSEAFV